MDNREQIEYWNGEFGDKWATYADALDDMLRPVSEAILDAAKIASHEEVIDIGCGAGSLALAAMPVARSVLGVDVSSPMLATASKRAARARAEASAEGGQGKIEFVLMDAAVAGAGKKYDVALSRFGVMFFADPKAAFINIRDNVKEGGRIAFACWQSIADNPWVQAPMEIVAPLLVEPPAPPAQGEPGPFAFADPAYVKKVLSEAGWLKVNAADWRGSVRLPGANMREAAQFALQMGPIYRLLKEQGLDAESVGAQILPELEERIAQLSSASDCAVLDAACWIVTARN